MREKMYKNILILLVLCFISCSGKTDKDAGKHSEAADKKADNGNREILFLSTQLNPVEEANIMRNYILPGFELSVDFQPNDNSYILKKMDFTIENSPEKKILLCCLHGDLYDLYKNKKIAMLDSLVTESDIRFTGDILSTGKFATEHQYYIPFLQAGYLMVANRKAIKYLPENADLNNLTYDELILWGENIYDETGSEKIGFPLGQKGLMHRFLQGYLYPSYTGSTLYRFKSDDALEMWKKIKLLWKYVNKSSLAYSSMSDPLLTDDVWIAWDHTARLINVFKTGNNDFIVFPSPSGPAGRGYMSVLSGLAVPEKKDTGEIDTDVENLIKYLCSRKIQSSLMEYTGFFPVVDMDSGYDIPEYLFDFYKALKLQSNGSNSITTVLPVGLGEKNEEFNSAYLVAFSEIVIAGKNEKTVLEKQAEKIEAIFSSIELNYWPPDNSLEMQDGKNLE